MRRMLAERGVAHSGIGRLEQGEVGGGGERPVSTFTWTLNPPLFLPSVSPLRPWLSRGGRSASLGIRRWPTKICAPKRFCLRRMPIEAARKRLFTFYLVPLPSLPHPVEP